MKRDPLHTKRDEQWPSTQESSSPRKRTVFLTRDLYFWGESTKETCKLEKRPLFSCGHGHANIPKETKILKRHHIHEKRPMLLKRDLYIWKETHISGKIPVFMKRDPYSLKRTRKTHLHALKETNVFPGNLCFKTDLHALKETYIFPRICLNRNQCSPWRLMFYNRPTCLKRDLYFPADTDMHAAQKRPMFLERDLCFAADTDGPKRDLKSWKIIM